MKKKITFIIILMICSTLLLLVLQLYWNYQAYRNNERTFKNQVNEKLDIAITELLNIRRDELSRQYKKWMLDTNFVQITCFFNQKTKQTIFSLKDKSPQASKPNTTFKIAIPGFKPHLNHLTPSSKQMFVDKFVEIFLYNDFKYGRVLFYTTSLGEKLKLAFESDKPNVKSLTSIYKNELEKIGITQAFTLQIAPFNFDIFNSISKDSLDKTHYFTKVYKYGFVKQMNIRAVFENSPLIQLQRMKWIIFVSLALMAITIGCFAYTIRSMLSQKKLALLKDNFVNNMTHELKTPVSTISIAAEAMQNFEINEATYAEYLQIIRAQAGNLTKLIDQILMSMLNEKAFMSLSSTKVSFQQLIESCIQLHQPQLNLTDAVLTTDLPKDQIWLKADPIHLTNVLVNLLDNAIKYSIDKPIIHISLIGENNNAIYSIRNNAVEIPKEYYEKVFERFFRIPTGNVHSVKGYGLGLSYANYIVQKHNGTLSVNSTTEFTTFTLTLPLYEFT